MKTVLFLLLGFSDTSGTHKLKTELEAFYHVKAKVAVAPMPRIAYEPGRNRYKADEILDFLVHMYPEYRVLAITPKDIAISKRGNYDWGIMGYSIVGQGVSVVSTYRTKSQARLVKVILHEYGHGKGLYHCNSKQPCVMKDVRGKGSNMDKQPKTLCIQCKSILH